MPHIIVEYSRSLEKLVPGLLNALHNELSAQGIDKARIKTRGIGIDHALVGEDGADGQMFHAMLLLLAGRDAATKKTYGDALHGLMKDTAPQGCAVTLEIRDMDPATYYL